MTKFTSVLALLLLPVLSVLADQHGPMQARHHARHAELANRAAETNNGTLEKRFSNTKWSWYDGNTGNKGSCGEWVRNNEYTVAMNPAQYKQSDCFKTITLRRNGVVVQARITDKCPVCPFGGLDLTPSLFQRFAPLGSGLLWDGSWDYGTGGGEPQPPPPPPPPRPTTTRRTTTRRPTPTTTWRPDPTPTTTRTRTRTTSRTSSRLSSTRVSSSREPTPSSERPSSSESETPSSSVDAANVRATGGATSGDNLNALNQAILRFADVIVVGAPTA